MNDKASQKPPSVFTRLFQGNPQSLSVDHLMADYEEEANRPAIARPHSRVSASPTRRAQQTHDAAVASVTTADSKRSGLFRFGRTIASSFNPANLWHKFQTAYKEAEEEIIAEQEAARVAKEAISGNGVDDRKARAEQAYAELKAGGYLKPTKVFVRGSGGPVNGEADAKQRDSGIEMDDARSSMENANSLSVPPSATSASAASENRKTPFHFKTPSLSNLKRARSEALLNTPLTPNYSQSPEKAQFDQERTIRKQQSKKDMQKQQKLSKRVSDLESKLEQARRELEQALGPAPPVPVFPAHLADIQTPRARLRSNSPQKKGFVPGALPSLPSERLLFPDQLRGDEASTGEELCSSVLQTKQSQKLIETADVARSSMVKGDIWTEDLETPIKPSGLAAAPKQKVTKKRKSGDRDDLGYKPESESNDDEEWLAAQTAKKRRANGKAAQKTSPKSKEKTNPLSKKHGGTCRLTKKNATIEETTSVVTAKAMKEDTVGADDTVHITKIPLKDEPSHPTAAATPAHPRERSRSSTGNKLKRKESHRSLSPASRSRIGSPDQIVTAAPDGVNVPPLPNMPRKSREDDGWDGYGEEIF
jgi:hypothetical protein